MTHLPLTLGEHTTASGPVTIIRIGKGGKWAYGPLGGWRVKTGKHAFLACRDITGRVDPAPDDPAGSYVPETDFATTAPDPAKWVSITGRLKKLPPAPEITVTYRDTIVADEPAPDAQKPLECWIGTYSNGEFPSMAARSGAAVQDYNPHLHPVRMIEAAPIETELARVTAQLEHWRQECGKLHSQVDRLTALNDHADELLDRADVLLVEKRADLIDDARTQRDEAVKLLNKVRDAVTAFHIAYDRREHGDLAAHRFADTVQKILGMPWVQGAALTKIGGE